jgi:hypothetical protein
MKIRRPCYITSRLCAGIDVGDATLSIEYSDGYAGNGRNRFHYFIDSPDIEYEGDDLTGIHGLQEGLASLLAFLSAAAESYRYTMGGHESDNADLFPPEVMRWAYHNADEIGMAEIDLEETHNIIQE